MSGVSHHQPAAPPPPPAPPLPPQQRYSNRAANAIARFAQPFLYPSRPTTANGNAPADRSSGLRPGLPRNSSPLLSQSTAHRTGIPIAALDISSDRNHAILAGRDILKTIQVSGSACTEIFNLRSAIIAYASTHNTSGGAISARHKDQLAANDVKWSHGRYDTQIATAAANGQIVVYDINRPGLELARLHQHNRQVHRLAINPYEGHWLLSGSQDATIRLWDLRELVGERSVATCHSVCTYPGNNQGIRDLRWSPTDGVQFAAATDNGVIQRWDFRKPIVPLLKINAHEKTCHSIDWHPDGKHLVSGGADKNIKIWDFSSTDRRTKVCWQLRAPKGVLNVRWRPACWTSEGRNPGSWQCTQLATSYDHHDPRVHIWDFRRPHMPLREIDRNDSGPTAMLWHSENLLWTIGNAGIFTQTDVNDTPKVSDCRSPNIVATAPNGQFNLFSEKRGRTRRSLDDVSEALLQREKVGGGDRFTGSHSMTDGSLEETSLLSSSFKSRYRRPQSTKSSKSIGSTPPTAGAGGPTIKLDEALQKQCLYQPAQVAAHGNIDGVFDDYAFSFLARYYTFPSLKPIEQEEYKLHEILNENFNRNASIAACVGEHRAAQSWRILGLAMEKELKARADSNRRQRQSTVKCPDSIKGSTKAGIPLQYHTSNANVPNSSHPARSKYITPLALENGSNMTTPIARPVPDSLAASGTIRHVTALDGVDSLRLPGPVWENYLPNQQVNTGPESGKLFGVDIPGQAESASEASPTSITISSQQTEQSRETTDSSSPTLDFLSVDLHMTERRAAIDNYRAKPREPLQFHDGGFLAPGMDRHDSNESLAVFSASTDSSLPADSVVGSLGVTGSLESREDSLVFGSAPERYEDGSRCDNRNGIDPVNNLESRRSTRGLPGGLSPPFLPADPEPVFQTEIENFLSPSATSPPLLRPSYLEPPIVHVDDFDIQDRHSTHAEQKSTTLPAYIPSDFSTGLQDQVSPAPWAATSMLAPLIAYHTTQLSSVQLPTYLLLSLAPHLHHAIPPSLIVSILLTYQTQLTSLSLHAQAAHIRNLAYPLYPEVSDHGTYGITPGGPWCTVCEKPSKGDRARYCERCNQPWASCPVCNGEGPISPLRSLGVDESLDVEIKNQRAGDTLWAWCQGCGHGGHVGCLRVWWEDAIISEGGCATVGCLDDCVGGSRREEALKKIGESRKTGIVKGDDWIVDESRAVERTRGLVVVDDAVEAKGAGGGKLQSPRGLGERRAPQPGGGLGTRSGSGGKRVRLVVPEEEGQGGQGVSQGQDSEELKIESAP